MVRFILIGLVILLLSGCQANNTPEMTPQEILEHSAERMQSARGFQVSIARSGASAFLDYENTLSLSKLTGIFVTPDRIQAEVRVIAPGVVVSVDVISIGNVQWQTNVITGEWEQLPENWGFNPATLLAAETGLPAILIADLSDLSVEQGAELEVMPGKKLFLVSGKLNGETLYDLSNWLMGPDPMDAQIWVDPQTFDLYRAVLIEYAGDPEKERRWQIDFWDFDRVIDIQPPI